MQVELLFLYVLCSLHNCFSTFVTCLEASQQTISVGLFGTQIFAIFNFYGWHSFRALHIFHNFQKYASSKYYMLEKRMCLTIKSWWKVATITKLCPVEDDQIAETMFCYSNPQDEVQILVT
jgi:hypothetical protein